MTTCDRSLNLESGQLVHKVNGSGWCDRWGVAPAGSAAWGCIPRTTL